MSIRLVANTNEFLVQIAYYSGYWLDVMSEPKFVKKNYNESEYYKD